MLGKCDKCKKEFIVKFKEKKYKRSVVKTYFKCTHCKKRYTCFVKDDEVRELQELIKTESSPFIRAGLQKQINDKMNKLKERYA